MWPLKMATSEIAEANRMAELTALDAVDEMVNPLRSSVTPLALMWMAVPVATETFVVR